MTMASIIPVASKLLGNGLRYQWQRLQGRPSLPQAVSLEVTRRCIARCIMCNIWKTPEPEHDLTCEQWLSFLNDPLFAHLAELDITGGEPFLRDDLPELIGGVCRMAGRELPRLASIAITTNGLLCDTVIEKTSAMLTTAQQYGRHIVIVCAVDAVDNLHDRIRNHPDAWAKVSRTIDALCDMRSRQPNLILGLKTTVLPLNADRLIAIRKYAEARGMFTIISPCIITPGRYLNPDRADDLAFDRGGIEKNDRLLQGRPPGVGGFMPMPWSGFCRAAAVKRPAAPGYNYFFVRSNGDMMLCPLIARIMGNITEQPPDQIYFSYKADAFRRKVAGYGQCKKLHGTRVGALCPGLRGVRHPAVLVSQRSGAIPGRIPTPGAGQAYRPVRLGGWDQLSGWGGAMILSQSATPSMASLVQ